MGVLDYAREGYREAKSRIPGQAPYDARNPASPVYDQPKAVTVGNRAVTPAEAGFGQIGDPYVGVLGVNDQGGAAGGGYGGGYGAVDPNIEARNNWLGSIPGAINNIGQNANDAFGGAGRSLRGNAEGLFNSVNQGQRAINTSRENVELNRLSGVKDILGFVRNGLRSGGSRLASMNAGESSATGELGRVFGSIGGDRMRTVGNKAFLDNRGIDTQQEGLDLQRNQGTTDFRRQRDDAVSTIGSQVRQQLAALEAQGQGLGITGKIAVDQERQRIIDSGLGQLNDIDAWLQGQLGGVRPQDQATTRTNAIALQQGGQGNITPFDFGAFQGPQVQGPAIDQLPLFTRNKKQLA